MQQTTFTPTEARQKFFTLLRMVEKGKDAFIVAKDRNFTFKLTAVATQLTDKQAILKKMTRSQLKTQSWERMKSLLEHRFES